MKRYSTFLSLDTVLAGGMIAACMLWVTASAASEAYAATRSAKQDSVQVASHTGAARSAQCAVPSRHA